ncbi:MAG TPA: hypothetical protein VK841_13670 [Polyangiaceae bacterium]|nr:hypothetical protein [Polyangiaceae bacterium]
MTRSTRRFAVAVATLGAFYFGGLAGFVGLARIVGVGGSSREWQSVREARAEAGLARLPASSSAAAGAQLVPASLAEARYWGNAQDGAVRATIAGMRVLATADETLLTVAQERFASEPAWVVALPDRLGGGFLFAVAKAIWRTDEWLGPAVPIFSSTGTVAEILVGVDRAYVRYPQGSLAAFDPRTGARMGLGSLPNAPHLGRVAAIDAWRSMAIADLEGVLMTNDAGNSWRHVALAVEPVELAPMPGLGAVAVGGKDKNRHLVWNAVRFDGAIEPLDAPPLRPGTPLALMLDDAGPGGPANAPRARSTGASTRADARAYARERERPLLAAVADGWPLGDGTAVLARDGDIARVRLADGRVVENEADAFALKPSRCHAVRLRARAFGFVCGEPRGATEVFAYDPVRKATTVLGRWSEPREVLSFGNGALAVRGPCDASRAAPRARARTEDVPADLPADEERYCISTAGTRPDAGQDSGWSELRVRGEQPDRARLAVLSDGRALLVRPPLQGDLSTARVTVIDGTRQTAHPIQFPALRADAARALRYGVWLDGFEERRPGVVGGWIDAAGSVIGIELPADDGEARVGEYIRDAGSPMVAGLWGFGWTASRGGFETVDGGMTWTKEIALPEPIAEPVVGRERACGPVGCVVAGWLRIGWGEAVPAPPPLPPEPVSAAAAAARGELRLSCELPAVQSSGARTAAAPPEARTPRKIMTPAMWGAVPEFAPFFGAPGPLLGPDDVGFAADASTGFERALHATPFARVYAWGPRSGEWDALGRWQVRWASAWWPYGASDGPGGRARFGTDTRSSSVAAVPWTTLDMARRALGIGPAVPTSWSTVPGDDADHALLVARHNQESPVAEVWELESGRPPIEVRPSGTDAFPDVQAAARIEGHWVLATAQGPSDAPAAVVWRVDGDVAHEVARIPRAGFEGASRVRFARRSDGRGLGMAIEGQPDLAQPPAVWMVAIDADSGAVSEPLSMAPLDASSHPGGPSGARSLCTADDAGWDIELPYGRGVRAASPDGASWVLRGAAAIARLGVERSCIAAVAGVAEGDDVSADKLVGAAAAPASDGHAPDGRPWTSDTGTGHGSSPTATVQTKLLFAQARVSLRCWQR